MKNHIVYDSDRIEQQEVVIADVHSLPVTNISEPFISPNLTISLNHCGTAITIYDMHTVEFKQHNIAIVLPDHIIGQGDTTDDYNVTLIIIAKAFYEELIHHDSFRDYLKYKTKKDFEIFDNIKFPFWTFFGCLLCTIAQIIAEEKNNTCIEETSELVLYCLVLAFILIYKKQLNENN